MAVPKEGIPVLMYHMIGDVPDNDAVLLESHFREQMKFLKDNDFHPLTMDQLYDYLAHANRCRSGLSSLPLMTLSRYVPYRHAYFKGIRFCRDGFRADV